MAVKIALRSTTQCATELRLETLVELRFFGGKWSYVSETFRNSENGMKWSFKNGAICQSSVYHSEVGVLRKRNELLVNYSAFFHFLSTPKTE